MLPSGHTHLCDPYPDQGMKQKEHPRAPPHNPGAWTAGHVHSKYFSLLQTQRNMGSAGEEEQYPIPNGGRFDLAAGREPRRLEN